IGDVCGLEKTYARGATPLVVTDDSLTGIVAQKTKEAMADSVFEASGSPAATRLTTAVVAHGGRVVLVGWNPGAVEIDTVTLMRKEVDLLGSRNSLNAFPAVLQLLDDGVVPANSLITHRFEFGE